MIVIANFGNSQELYKLHGFFEHTKPGITNSFVVHYVVDGNEAQDIYIGKQWSELIPKIQPLFEIIDDIVTVVVTNAVILDLEGAVDGMD